MDILHARGESTVADVLERLADAPSYSAVRALLRTLEEKGHIVHTEVGRAYRYRPRVAQETAQRSALSHVVRTFFVGNWDQAMLTLLDSADTKVSDAVLARMEAAVKKARREGR